jgi:hypothetical protein
MTLPEKPRSPKQRYRITRIGLEVLNQANKFLTSCHEKF